MPRYKYLIVGGGMAAAAAVSGIRKLDPNGSIGLIGGEPYPPYKRPPLSKALWKGESVERIWLGTHKQGVEMHLANRATSLDALNKRVTAQDGGQYTFEKLLLATGGTPRRLPFDRNDHGDPPPGKERIIYYRTFADYERLRQLAGTGSRFAVVGSGFIGSEVAAALAMNGKQVTLLLRHERIGQHMYPTDLGNYLNRFYRQKGVELLANTSVTGAQARGKQLALQIRGSEGSDQQELVVDGLVVGIGIQPNVGLAKQAGLEVTDGIAVDPFLRTGHLDIYVAGDVANFQGTALGKRRRVEHEDNANTMGEMAGCNMAGAEEPYDHLPFFYSDLFELGYEAVGETDASLETVADWKEPYREGVIYYLRDGRVRGVLLWNVWEQVEAARNLIREPGPFKPQDLMGRIPA